MKLPTNEHKQLILEGQVKVEGEEKTVAESCTLLPAKAMEYSHVVSVFPTGDTAPTAARWLVGKPFSAGYTVAASATLKAETSACSAAEEAAAKAKAKALESVSDDKKGRKKVRVKSDAKLTAVQEYGVGLKDTILGEETDGNRTIDVVPLDSLWSHWTAVGGTKRSREEQQRQASLFSSSKKDDDEDAAEVEQPKKKARKEGKKHSK